MTKAIAIFVLGALAVYSFEAYEQRDRIHSHKCAKCGNVWSHSSRMRGNKLAHTCSMCMSVQWQQYIPGLSEVLS